MQAQNFSKIRVALAAASLAAFGLAGCDTLPAPVAPSDSAAATPAAAPAPERDVTRTDLFNVTEGAIWDGRPTFGGVWVAYAGDIQPERVRITNRANGKTVIGALFRRERETPGPAIQVSADAASALGMVAGTPVQLSVTALRREAVETPAPAPATTETAEAPAAEPAAEARPVARTATPPAAIAETPLEGSTPAAPPATAPAGAPARPYVQVGTFATQSNANDLVTILGTNNVTAGVRQVEVDGRTLYRVVAGPAASAEALAALVARLKELGYADAFPIR